MKRKTAESEFEKNCRKRITELIDEFCEGKQIVFSRKTGIPKGTVSHYVNGGNSPSDEYAEKIAHTFNVNVQWLKGYDVPKDAPNNGRNIKHLAEVLDEIKTHNEMIFANVFDSVGCRLEESEFKGEYIVTRFSQNETASIRISSSELRKFTDGVEQYAELLVAKLFESHKKTYSSPTLLAARPNDAPDAGDSDFPEDDQSRI